MVARSAHRPRDAGKRAPGGRFLVSVVSAYPPDRGRLSEFASELLQRLVSSYPFRLELLTDSPSKDTDLIRIVPTWRPDRPLNILALWARILGSKSRLVHLNVHMAVFGRGRLVNFLGLATALIARLSGKRVLVSLHNVPDAIDLTALGWRSGLLFRLGLRLAALLLLRSAHAVVVTMRSYVALLKRAYGAKRVHWIPHGAWFAERGGAWSWGKRSVLFLGYLGPYKAVEALAEAVEEASRQGEVKLLVAGVPHPNFPEHGRQALARLRQRRAVAYLGWVRNEDLPELIGRVGVAVLPYRTSTGTSGVLHLLSGLGVPFVASDTPELRELKREGAGLLLTSLEPRSLASAILRALEDRRLAEQLSSRSMAFARARSWNVVARAYARLYAGLLRPR